MEKQHIQWELVDCRWPVLFKICHDWDVIVHDVIPDRVRICDQLRDCSQNYAQDKNQDKCMLFAGKRLVP